MERYRMTPDAAVYFVTWSVVEWLPVFISGAACEIVTQSLEYCRTRKGLRTNAFVIMPTHLHAIVFHDSYRADALSMVLTELRKFTGRSLSDYSCNFLPPCFGETLRQSAGADRERRFWQSGRHPVAVQSESFYLQKLNYLHENPVRKGLTRRARDWRFSSANWFATDTLEPCEIALSKINW